MKKSNLKTALNYIVLFLLIILLALVGCTTEAGRKETPIYSSETSQKETGINGVKMIAVDQHEYIVLWSDAIIHNENCPNKYHIYNKPE